MFTTMLIELIDLIIVILYTTFLLSFSILYLNFVIDGRSWMMMSLDAMIFPVCGLYNL